MPTLIETLTRYFYLWERCGRGWDYQNIPVTLEPPFIPFHPPSPRDSRVKDDGLHPTIFHFFFRLVFPKKRPEGLSMLMLPEPRPVKETDIHVFSISLPRSFDLDGYEAKQLLLMLSYCSYPVSFEVIGKEGSMSVQIACAKGEADHVLSQLKTTYPTCTILTSEDSISLLSNTPSQILEFGMAQEFMRPLSMADDDSPSLYLGIKGIFDTLQSNECACVQVLFQGTRHPWPASILRSVSDGHGHSFFEDAPDMPKLAQKKTSSQLFGVVIRAVACGNANNRRELLLRNLGNALAKSSASTSNSLIPLPDDDYDADLHLADVLSRRSRRYGMLLNTDELALFVHVPDDAVLAKSLSLTQSKTKALPAELKNHRHVLGLNIHQGVTVPATVIDEQRYTHTHVIGATGTGKSTYLLHSIRQDILKGHGVAAIDPHGDWIEAILNFIPENRLKDVIIVDPSDSEYSVGFNILKANTELEKEVLSSDLVSIFQKLSTSWGDQMTSVLANALIAFLESSEGGTLVDVRKFLLEPSFRASVLKTVSDDAIRYYWQHEFPLIKTNSIGSILTRLDTFLRPKAIRHMVMQKEGLNFDDILNTQKILLVKLSHGLSGESNSYLLGSLFLSKIYQTALSRQNAKASDRKGFFVYVDEFQHYLVPSLSHLLSGARKYSIGLTLAHQSLEQISSSNSELASSLISNAGIRICFRLGEGDAQKMEKGFASFDAADLMNLGTGQALCRVGRSDMDFNISIPREPLDDNLRFIASHDVIDASRRRYGTLRSTLASPSATVIAEESIAIVQDETSVDEMPEEKRTPPKSTVEKDVSKEETKVIEDPEFIQSIVKRKEESKHRYLQMLIKRNAESRGYKAVLEQPTKDGSGRIDIVLQKDKLTYAVEVGVTTTKEWEVHNIEKCLADGFENIVALSEDIKGADLMTRKLTEAGILPIQGKKVRVYDLTGFMGVLNADPVPEKSKGKTIKGYRVKVEYKDE